MFFPHLGQAETPTGEQRLDHINFPPGPLVYQGDGGAAFEHNGSSVIVFERAGLIVYEKPKSSIAAVVRRGDILFSGVISSRNHRIEGVARVFKRGCPPARYHVVGHAVDFVGGDFTMRGDAPIHDPASCAIIGTSKTNNNATLRLRWDGGD